MLTLDRDALLCDMAQTYGVYDLRALPPTTVAALAVGLREDSRIKMQLGGIKVSRTEMLLAAMVDRLSLLVWTKTEDGRKGRNQPKSVLQIITGERKTDTVAFATEEEFVAAWEDITGVKYG